MLAVWKFVRPLVTLTLAITVAMALGLIFATIKSYGWSITTKDAISSELGFWMGMATIWWSLKG